MRGVWVLLIAGCAGQAGGPDAADPVDARVDGADDVGSDAGDDRGPSDAAVIDGGARTIAGESARLAEAECDFLARCQERSFTLIHGEDRAACVDAVAGRWTSAFTIQRARSSALEWNGLGPCFAQLRSGPCYEDPFELGGPCAPNVLGSIALGAACFVDLECQSGVCRTGAPGVDCGRCAAPVEQDGPCEPGVSVCAAGTACLGGLCTRLPPVGERCADHCRGYLDCTRDFEGSLCLPRLSEGENCAPWPLGQGPMCAEERSLVCIDQLRCERARYVEPGEACDALRLCRPTRYRDSCQAGICVEDPPVPLGGPCSTDASCVTDAYCATGTTALGRCRPQLGQGESCASNLACAPPLRCLGGGCRPFEWRLCP